MELHFGALVSLSWCSTLCVNLTLSPSQILNFCMKLMVLNRTIQPLPKHQTSRAESSKNKVLCLGLRPVLDHDYLSFSKGRELMMGVIEQWRKKEVFVLFLFTRWLIADAYRDDKSWKIFNFKNLYKRNKFHIFDICHFKSVRLPTLALPHHFYLPSFSLVFFNFYIFSIYVMVTSLNLK